MNENSDAWMKAEAAPRRAQHHASHYPPVIRIQVVGGWLSMYGLQYNGYPTW